MGPPLIAAEEGSAGSLVVSWLSDADFERVAFSRRIIAAALGNVE